MKETHPAEIEHNAQVLEHDEETGVVETLAELYGWESVYLWLKWRAEMLLRFFGDNNG